MRDPLIPLCQIIAEKLREHPQADPTALVAYLRETMAAVPDFAAAIQTDERVVQINQGDTTTFQTWVTGGIANIGINLNGVDTETLTLVLERFFREQLSNTQTIVDRRANRGGEPKRSFDEKLKAVSGVLSILIGLLALMPQVRENLSKAIEAFVKLPPFVWLFAAAILLIVGFFALLDGLSRRSHLLRPDALLLQVGQPQHLKGRDDDVNRLSTLCYDAHQVHLVGESGVGKSALIQAGLCPVLKSSKGLFPIHLNIWGQDWETGPRTGLTRALWEVLSEDERDMLGLAEFPTADQLVMILGQFQRKLGRTPLIIFDQFDDYQTRHRSQFLPGRRRTWIPAGKLLETNTFWRDIKSLIDIQAVRCLFATRRDNADGLESIRFARPEVYWLDRLNGDFVLPLLTELTADVNGENPVVYAPERGWERLKDRLARNLGHDGAALPAQMKIVLQGLASLQSLTVRDYERVGGLQGLEATHIERQIANTAYNFVSQ